MRFFWVIRVHRDHTTPVIVLVELLVLLLQFLHLLISHLIRAVLTAKNLVSLVAVVLVTSEQVGPEFSNSPEHVAEFLFSL